MKTLVLILTLAIASTAYGEEVFLQVRICDAVTKKPIPGASSTCNWTDSLKTDDSTIKEDKGISDKEGKVKLPIPIKKEDWLTEDGKKGHVLPIIQCVKPGYIDSETFVFAIVKGGTLKPDKDGILTIYLEPDPYAKP